MTKAAIRSFLWRTGVNEGKPSDTAVSSERVC